MQDLDSGRHGSGFPLPPWRGIPRDSNTKERIRLDAHAQEYSQHAWNINNMPRSKGSVLRYMTVPEPITGEGVGVGGLHVWAVCMCGRVYGWVWVVCLWCGVCIPSLPILDYQMMISYIRLSEEKKKFLRVGTIKVAQK